MSTANSSIINEVELIIPISSYKSTRLEAPFLFNDKIASFRKVSEIKIEFANVNGIDFSKILKVAQDNGMKYFIVEQERYDNSTPLESAKVGADYLKKLVFT